MVAEKYDTTTPPSSEALEKAGALNVYDEDGKEVALGSLFKDQKTIAIWIRHFRCGLCQEFIGFLDSRLKSEDLEKAGVKLVIIGCGEWEYIKPYRDLLQTPFPIYADPTKQTYIALGMTMRTLDAGKETPEYVKTTALGNVMMSIGQKALKMGRILGNPGDIKQLGGEFVLGPGNTCSYVRRMENTRGHSPLAELLAAAGVESSS
ncbi:hypothetical protein T439DRAFT_287409 [Meredithblackwellia eburnea MCA 4105]